MAISSTAYTEYLTLINIINQFTRVSSFTCAVCVNREQDKESEKKQEREREKSYKVSIKYQDITEGVTFEINSAHF